MRTFPQVLAEAREEIAKRPQWMRDVEAWRREEQRKADERRWERG